MKLNEQNSVKIENNRFFLMSGNDEGNNMPVVELVAVS